MTGPTAPPYLDPTGVVSMTVYSPSGENLGMSDIEQRVMHFLAHRLLGSQYRAELALSRLYYDGMNTVSSLGIAIPPELEPLRVVMGWCGAAVAARSERLTLQGFRMPGKTTIDTELQQAWQANNLDAESTLVHDDALIYHCSYVVVGTQTDQDEPLTTIESPLDMTASWDRRRREVSAAYRTYFDQDPASETYFRQLATLYTRTATIHMVLGDQGWQVIRRDDHGMGFVPVLMFANNPTSRNPYGTSEIAPSWRNTQDRAARGVARNEVAAEIFAALKVWLLGVKASDLVKPDGSQATAFETFIGRVSTLDADEHGVLPQVEIQQGQDPSGMIKFIDHQASIFSGNAAVPLDYLGIVSDGNPTAADAITKGDYRLMKRAQRLLTQFGNGWEDWARMVLRVKRKQRDDEPEWKQIESDWSRPSIPTPNADAVTVTTQIAAGMISPDSDDALAACGWSAVQRQRIGTARDRYRGEQLDGQLLAGMRPRSPQQPLDGEQPTALNRLQQQRDGVVTGN